MYTEVGDFDAVVCAAGAVTFAPLADLTSMTTRWGFAASSWDR